MPRSRFALLILVVILAAAVSVWLAMIASRGGLATDWAIVPLAAAAALLLWRLR